MRFNQIFGCVALVTSLLLSAFATPAQEVIQKKRIALLNFEDHTGTEVEAARVFGADAGDAGKGISALLIQKLNAGGKYTLVDQSAIKTMLKEQDSSEDSRLDVYGRAAKIGRLLGLDAMIVGAITRFGPDTKQKGEGSGHSGLSTWKSKAYVDITARVLTMSTAEVIAEFTATGESSHTGEVMRVKPRGHSADSQDILGSEFTGSLLAEATQNAVEKIAGQLNIFAAKIPVLTVEFTGLVAEVVGNSVTLNIGKKSGLKVGDKLSVIREVSSVTDPQTAASLPRALERIGEVTITEVSDQYSTAIFAGSRQVQVGDRVKSSAAPPIPSH